MTRDEMKEWLEGEIASFPERASGEEGYRFMVRQTARVLDSDRQALVAVLRDWLLLRAEPRTMLAVEIAAFHHVDELRSDIEDLLEDVREGEAFKPYYVRPIMEALSRI